MFAPQYTGNTCLNLVGDGTWPASPTSTSPPAPQLLQSSPSCTLDDEPCLPLGAGTQFTATTAPSAAQVAEEGGAMCEAAVTSVAETGQRRKRKRREIRHTDGYTWLKYGEKRLPAARVIREYFKCKNWRPVADGGTGCTARKVMDRPLDSTVEAPGSDLAVLTAVFQHGEQQHQRHHRSSSEAYEEQSGPCVCPSSQESSQHNHPIPEPGPHSTVISPAAITPLQTDERKPKVARTLLDPAPHSQFLSPPVNLASAHHTATLIHRPNSPSPDPLEEVQPGEDTTFPAQGSTQSTELSQWNIFEDSGSLLKAMGEQQGSPSPSNFLSSSLSTLDTRPELSDWTPSVTISDSKLLSGSPCGSGNSIRRSKTVKDVWQPCNELEVFSSADKCEGVLWSTDEGDQTVENLKLDKNVLQLLYSFAHDRRSSSRDAERMESPDNSPPPQKMCSRLPAFSSRALPPALVSLLLQGAIELLLNDEEDSTPEAAGIVPGDLSGLEDPSSCCLPPAMYDDGFLRVSQPSLLSILFEHGKLDNLPDNVLRRTVQTLTRLL